MMKPAIEIEVRITDPGWRAAVRGAAGICRRAGEAALARASRAKSRRTIAFLLTDDAEMRRLNRTFRGKNKPTNVLSFPAGREPVLTRGMPRHLGDIALGLQTVAREAKEQGKTVRSHLCHLAVHGTLHLIGHDHMKEAEAERMEALERRILAGLGIDDPYRLPEDAP